jgi:hypothetical protein
MSWINRSAQSMGSRVIKITNRNTIATHSTRQHEPTHARRYSATSKRQSPTTICRSHLRLSTTLPINESRDRVEPVADGTFWSASRWREE